MTPPNKNLSDQEFENLLADHFDNPTLYVDGDIFSAETLNKIQRVNALKFITRLLFTFAGFFILYMVVPWDGFGSELSKVSSEPITVNLLWMGTIASVLIQWGAISKIRT